MRRLALLCIGEIGRRKNLSDFPQLQLSLTHALASTSEDIRAAASLALGGVSVGNMDAYLPFLIQQIDEQVGPQEAAVLSREPTSCQCLRHPWHQSAFGTKQGSGHDADLLASVAQAESPKDQYLLLKALNEVIVSLTAMGSTKALDIKHQSEAMASLDT